LQRALPAASPSDLSLSPWAPAAVRALLALLTESANFKIRTHAAAAVAQVPHRAAWGGLYAAAVEALAAALAALDHTTGGVFAGEASGGAGGAGSHGVDFADLKCRPALRTQLTATLLHLLRCV
jgi:hypothetical protein